MNYPQLFPAEAIARIGMDKAIELMREAFQLLSEGKIRVPLRTALETDDKSGMALFMPSYAPSWKLFGLKMVSVFTNNPPPLPAIQGQMLLMDASDGRLLALLDAPAVTALRTGAASGLATQSLAREDGSTLAVFGTGVQASSQVAGVLAARAVNQVLVRGTSAEKESAFCQRIADKFNVSCIPLGAIDNLQSADIICTATNSERPLFERKHLKVGVHINAIGSYKPHMRELSEDVVGHGKLVVDQRDAVLHEAGELVIPIKEGRLTSGIIYAELGEIVAGKAGRTSANELTIFKSVGNAVQDLAIARHLILSK